MPYQSDNCKVPVSARVEIINGKAVMTDAKYRDIPADIIAKLLLDKFGLETIERGGEETWTGSRHGQA